MRHTRSPLEPREEKPPSRCEGGVPSVCPTRASSFPPCPSLPFTPSPPPLYGPRQVFSRWGENVGEGVEVGVWGWDNTPWRLAGLDL